MGLDGVELVMDVEDHFGITIQEATAERIRTVGDLVSLVYERLFAAQSSHCPTLPAFVKLRALVRDLTYNQSLRIRPHQEIADILTPQQRSELWKHLPKLLGTSPPQLRRPSMLRTFLGGSALLLIAVALFTALAVDFRTFPLTMALAVFAIYCLNLLTQCFRIMPPNNWVTFGDVTAKIVGTSMATKNLHLRTQEEVFNELRSIIVEALGVDLHEVKLSARFIEDLGAG